jgi:hypothetical protein
MGMNAKPFNTTRLHYAVFFAACRFFIVCFSASTPAVITVGAWTPIYKGIDHTTGQADAAEPRIQKVYAMRIDLADPDIEFYTTPSNGAGADETNAQKCSQFLVGNNLQIAINANFFLPACNFGGGGTRNLEGLAISQGVIVSPQEAAPRANSLLITQNNTAWFAHTPFDTIGVHNAVTGDVVLVSNGINVGGVGEAHPRTAAGLSQDNRYLILLAIDGRQPGYSDGATYAEAADWLIRLGGYNGVNLDGGGSTTMVISNNAGGAVVLNKPIGGGLFCNSSGERYNGNNFGVRAYKLPDVNKDSFVNIEDFAIIANYWQSVNCGSCGDADLNNDHNVGDEDILIFAANWLSDF